MLRHGAFIHDAKVLHKFEMGFLLKFDDLS